MTTSKHTKNGSVSLHNRPQSQKPFLAAQRRRKRIKKRNGDRAYFAAVRKLRRDGLDKWILANNPEKMKKRLVQLTMQAKKRQFKQERRDLLKTMPVGTRVKVKDAPRGVIGVVDEITRDREFPVTVEFSSGIIEDFAPEKLEVVE